MAKSVSLVLGVDIGHFSLKAVLLQKKGGGRFVINDYAIQPRDPANLSHEELVGGLKALVKQVGSAGKASAVAISDPEALLRIIDQPDTPTDILRDALRLNGLTLLNQDCRDFVLDCDYIETADAMSGGHKRYLAGGLPRTQVISYNAALTGGGINNVSSLQLSPVSIFNAFEFAQPDTFNQQPFFLIDFGHASSTMIVGSKRELVLVRNIEFGGKLLIDTLQNLSGESPEMIMEALQHEEEIIVENARMAIAGATREISSSIGFFEGRREEAISKVWVSGGIAQNPTMLRLLSEELNLPCSAWNALERCETGIPSGKRAKFPEEALQLNTACGAAVELLNQ